MSGNLTYFNSSTASCPQCSHTLIFKNVTANIIQCPQCNNVIERTDDYRAIQKHNFTVPAAQRNSVIAIGTKGKYKDKNFEVAGAMYCEMERFNNNRWQLIFADGTTALLTETLGFYAIQKKIDIDYPGKIQQLKGNEFNSQTVELIKNQPMRLVDKARCEKIYIEGEVCLTEDSLFTAYELAGADNNRIEILEFAKGYTEAYEIFYLPLQQLSLTAKATEKVPVQKYACGKCSKEVTIKLPQYTRYCICTYCDSLNEHIRGVGLMYRQNKLSKFTTAIPVGAKGSIKGTAYEVTGVVRKYESGSKNTQWTEYVLFNEETGFAFLSEYNGHFSFLKEVKTGLTYPVYQKEIFVGSENFVLYNDYMFGYTAAAGEFYTSFKNYDVQAKEFISPPEMYAVEKNPGKEVTWFYGEYIYVKDVAAAFNMSNDMLPSSYGVGALQPMKGYINMRLLRHMSLLALLVFFAVQAIFSFAAADKEVLDQSFTVADSTTTKAIVSSSFTLMPASSNVKIFVSAPVANSWFEAAITMVNEKTGKEYEIEKGVEYYFGVSEGESWSEGGTSQDAVISSVPQGTYHLNIFTSSGGEKTVNDFNVVVKNDVPMWRNFLVVVLIAALFPLIQWLRAQLFERSRWNSSPYNPYVKEEN